MAWLSNSVVLKRIQVDRQCRSRFDTIAVISDGSRGSVELKIVTGRN